MHHRLAVIIDLAELCIRVYMPLTITVTHGSAEDRRLMPKPSHEVRRDTERRFSVVARSCLYMSSVMVI